jgi:voltage-gated potassium channel
MSRRLRPYTKLTQPPLGPAPARRRREILLAALDLGVFVLAMSEFVRLLPHGPTDGKTGGFLDALAATVALVTPTRHGDVPLEGGTGGHLLSVVIIVGGLSLALRLGRACLRGGGKVRAPCPGCGRRHHDRDAAHCTACGRRLLDIPDGHR